MGVSSRSPCRPTFKALKILMVAAQYTGCFRTCGHYCRRWFPRSLWSKKFIQGDQRESDGFKKKVLGRFSTWNGFIFTKLKVKTCHLSQVFKYGKIMSFRWRPSSWMQFSILHLKSSIARANSCWSIVNTSCRMASWAPANARNIHERPFHSARVTVWCAVAHFGVIGPYFFEEDGVTVTVNSERNIHMLNNFLRPELWRRRINMRNVYFQQDGATAHTPVNVLWNMFPGCLISCFGDVP